MIKLKTKFLQKNMVLANDIYTEKDGILLSSGMKLKETYIDKLLELGISEVYIRIPNTEDIVIDDVIKTENRQKAQGIIKETMNRVCSKQDLKMQEIWVVVEQIINDLMNKDNILVNLSLIKCVDEYTFSHSINVCIYALIVGISKGYEKDKLMELGVGAILHDIGKMFVDPNILNKPSRLNEEEYEHIKSHAKLGYDLVMKNKDISEASAQIILTHHERFDGGGYPLKIAGSKIQEYSRIVAICDVFDALTSDRVYRNKELPHKAVEYLISMGHHQFDYNLVKEFISHIPCYPIGTLIKLSNEEVAVVYKIYEEYPNRPIVKCIEKGKSTKILDLLHNPSVEIIGVLERI